MEQQDPKQRAAITFLLFFMILIAGYIILSTYSKANAQDLPHKIENVPLIDQIHEAFDIHDPLHGIPGIEPMEDPIAAMTFLTIPPNPFSQPGYSQEEWKKHYEYNYYLWLEYRPYSDVEAELLEKEKQEVQHAMFKSVLQHLIHCVRRKDSVPILNPVCRRAYGGCEARINALTWYIVDVAYALNIDPWLMAAVAMHESTFNPYAVGYAVGERGFMQIHPGTPLGKRTRFVRSERYRRQCRKVVGNCQLEVAQAGGIHLYRDLKKCNGNVERGLTAYNTGGCLYKGHIRRKYVKKVIKLRDSLKRGFRPSHWCDGIGNEKVLIMFSQHNFKF